MYENLTPLSWVSKDEVLNNHEYYRLFSSILTHGDFLHIISNCLLIYVMGSRVERYMGSFFLLIAFLISGLSGSVATVFLTSYPSLGASGSAFGLVGCAVSYILLNRRSMDGFDLNFMLIYSIFAIGFGFLVPNINYIAHIAGFAVGIILGIFYTVITAYFQNNTDKASSNNRYGD
jgi:rhomboid protease GluP